MGHLLSSQAPHVPLLAPDNTTGTFPMMPPPILIKSPPGDGAIVSSRSTRLHPRVRQPPYKASSPRHPVNNADHQRLQLRRPASKWALATCSVRWHLFNISLFFPLRLWRRLQQQLFLRASLEKVFEKCNAPAFVLFLFQPECVEAHLNPISLKAPTTCEWC